MAKATNNSGKKSFWDKIRYKYRLIILNEDTYEQKASIRLSRMNMYVMGSVILVVLVSIITAIIAFTPLKYYMPGVGSIDVRSELMAIEMRTDSLESELEKRNFWLQNIQNVLKGDVDSMMIVNDSVPVHSETPMEDLATESKEETQFKEEIKDEISLQNSKQVSSLAQGSSFNYLKFVVPTDGVVVSDFNASQGHLGVDIAGNEHSPIHAVESGYVINAEWSYEYGYVIGIQHRDNTLSFYKHNAEILKKIGNFVDKGEVIALMGNTGALTNGPHLHFELWQNGKAINPLLFINLTKLEE